MLSAAASLLHGRKGQCVMDGGEWSGRGVSGARDGSVGTGLSGSSACTNVRAVAVPTPTICMLLLISRGG